MLACGAGLGLYVYLELTRATTELVALLGGGAVGVFATAVLLFLGGASIGEAGVESDYARIGRGG